MLRVPVLSPALFSSLYTAADSHAQSGKPVIVGRVTYCETQLLRYMPEAEDWTATKDTPIGALDTFYAAPDDKSEFQLLDDSIIRLGGGSQGQLLRFEPEAIEIDVTSGLVRFYAPGSDSFRQIAT